MYYILYFLVIIGVINELSSRKRNQKYFDFCYFIATLMAVLRYGQGTDYFNYANVYRQIEISLNRDFLSSLAVTDSGYCLLCDIGLVLGLPYEAFVMVISLLMMVLFYRFLSKNCNYSMFSLLVFVSLIYMIYIYSAQRQGLAMAFFYGQLYPLLIKKKSVQYYCGTFLIGFIHASAWFFILFPSLKKVKIRNQYVVIFLVSILVMFVSSNILDYIPIPFIKARIEYYLGESTSNAIFAKLFRIIVLIPIVLMKNADKRNEHLNVSRHFMLVAFITYSLFSFSEATASRLWGLFLGFECLFLSNISITFRKSFKRFSLLSFYTLLLVVMWFKDLGAAIDQGSYKHCNMFTYPYVALFEGESTLEYYRPIHN